MAEIFGNLRAPKTLGLAGMMRPEARIFHEILFDSNGVGRVSDLIAARMKRAIPDDLEFRASLLFGVVDASRYVVPGSPIRIESGIDNEKIGISIVFSIDPQKPLKTDGLRERVLGGRGSDRVEQMLHELLHFCERLIVKFQPATGLVDVCILTSLGRGVLTPTPRDRGVFEVVVLPAELQPAVSVAEYSALGDLDYAKLLRIGGITKEPLVPPSGEILLHAAKNTAALQEAVRLKRLKMESPLVEQVAGKRPEPEPEQVIAADPPESAPDEVKISGVTQKIESDDTALVISGEPAPEKEELEVHLSESPVEPKKKSFLGGLFSVFSKKKVTEEHAEVRASTQDKTSEDWHEEEQSTHGPEGAETMAPVLAMREIQTLVRDFEAETEQGAFSRLVDRMDRERGVLKSDMKNSKAEKWIDGLAGELVAERARLAEMAKKLSQSVRQKELEFKNRENSLIQSVRTRDENLRSKTLQLMRMRDQVAKLQMSVERARSSAAGAEESAAKIKLSQTQRLLQTAKSENEQLQLKLQDLKSRLEQSQEHKKQMVSGATYAELQRKLEQQAKQLEELKKASKGTPEGDGDSEAA